VKYFLTKKVKYIWSTESETFQKAKYVGNLISEIKNYFVVMMLNIWVSYLKFCLTH